MRTTRMICAWHKCGKEVVVSAYLVEKRNKKYCSWQCYRLSKKGMIGVNAGRTWKISDEARARKNYKPNARGHIHSAETIKKISLARKGKHSGEDHYEWKGDNVGYGSLHKWVRKMLGTPEECANCGESGLTGHKIHWANISGKYKRIINDWVRLCAKCHSDYDKGKLKLSEIGGY